MFLFRSVSSISRGGGGLSRLSESTCHTRDFMEKYVREKKKSKTTEK